MRAGQYGQFAFGQGVPETLRFWTKENFLETLLVEIAEITGAIIVVTIAGQCAVAIDGDIYRDRVRIALQFAGRSCDSRRNYGSDTSC